MNAEDLNAMRAALVVARSSGHLEVEFNSGGTRHRMIYRSVAEIQSAIDALDRDLAAISGTRVKRFVPYYDKGFSE
ncbi:hypothetical protein P9A16_07105 [Shinella sp. 838]|uniref:phage head-tail joining protein n=1 Tax=Shinella sp. 838 TaxID=3038164 RepID=UPI0024157B91|nr:hypothetical protein [Shinella sp. 838]MDG4670885.1 hypothetical protein [Shinella sp. 838]